MKPKYVGVLVASLYIVFKITLYFISLQYEVLMGKALLILLAFVFSGIFYVINYYIRNSSTYDWIVAFKKGLTVSLVASLLAGLFVFVYYKWIDVSYLDNLAVLEYNQLKSTIPTDKLVDYNAQLKNRYSPNTFFMVTISLVNIAGLFGSIIVAMLGRLTIRRN